MESEVFNFGSSLIVPSVQELAKQKLDAIPPRYVIQEDQHQPINHFENNSNDQVPIIDMERLLSQYSMHSELANLHFACKNCGFFQLINHEVSNSLVEKLKIEVKKLFGLPMEEKKKLWQFPGQVEGFGQAFVVSEEQKLDWSDMFFLVTHPLFSRKSHLFSSLPLSFREALDAYSWEMKNLAMAIIAQMAKALKVEEEEEEEMKGIFEDGIQSIRMNYYPPCPQPDKVIGLTPHSDAGGLTILLQVNEVEGLQVKKDGKWVSINPLPHAFVINIGDIMEVISNGTYRSIEHRATVNLEKERLSIATFYSPSYITEIKPMPSFITKQSPALFKRTLVGDYFHTIFNRKLQGKSNLDTLRI